MVREDTILIVHADRKAARQLAACLGPVGAVAIAATVADAVRAVDAAAPAALVIDDRLRVEPGCDAVVARARAGGCRGCVVLHDPAAVPSRALFDVGWLHHVVTARPPVLAEELVVTVAKLVRGDLFGIDRYLTWAADTDGTELTTTDDRLRALDELAGVVERIGLSRRDGGALALAADELLQNAIHNAPVDDAGRRYLRDEPRDRFRALDPRERPALRWGYDGRWFAVSVRDQFGSLDPDTLVRYLRKSQERRGQVRTEGAGAGIGLAMTYDAVRQLVFDVEPGRATEVIALVDARPWPPTAQPPLGSFHLFVAGGAP